MVKNIQIGLSQYGFKAALKFMYCMRGLDLDDWNSLDQIKTMKQWLSLHRKSHLLKRESITHSHRRLNYLCRMEVLSAITFKRFYKEDLLSDLVYNWSWWILSFSYKWSYAEPFIVSSSDICLLYFFLPLLQYPEHQEVFFYKISNEIHIFIRKFSALAKATFFDYRF